MRRSKVFLTFDEAQELDNELLGNESNDIGMLYCRYYALRRHPDGNFSHSDALRLMHVSSLSVQELAEQGRNGATAAQILNYVHVVETYRARAGL